MLPISLDLLMSACHFSGSDEEAIRTPRFFDMGVKIAYDFKLYKTVDLQLSGGVQNIFEAYQKDFDRGANRDSNYIYGPSLPRSFFAGVKISY